MKKRTTLLSLGLAVLALLTACGAPQPKKTGSSSSAERTALVLDTDLGTDDATAILLMKEMGIVPDYMIATPGNASPEGAVRNAAILKKYLNLSSQVVSGTSFSGSDEEGDFHGPDGLAGISSELMEKLELTDQEVNSYISLDDFSKEICGYDSVYYICTGPLSNLSILLDDPEVDQRLTKIYLMGGGISEFNTSHDTEFNFSKNPEADQKVLSAGHDLYLFTLDLTNHQRISYDQVDELEKTGNLPEYITFLRYNHVSNLKYDEIDATVLHDTMPALFYKEPEEFQTIPMRVSVDQYGHLDQDEKNGSPITYVKSVKENLLYESLEKAFEDREIRDIARNK